MEEHRRALIEASSPYGRFMIGIYTTLPFFFVNIGFYAWALRSPGILAGLDAGLLRLLLAVQLVALAVELALLAVARRRRRAGDLGAVPLLFSTNLGLNYICLLILTGPYTSPLSPLVIGFLAPGLLLFNQRAVIVSFMACMVPVLVNEVLLVSHRVTYAPLLSMHVLEPGHPAARWWSALRNYAFYASMIMNSLTAFFMFNLLDRKREQLRMLSLTDGLTGVANRRCFMERLEVEARRRSRHGRAFSVVLCDVDHFKRINDSHGHDVGDIVLTGIARLLDQGTRGRTDLAARLGGEEFALLLPETPASAARIVCERIAERLRAQSFVAGDTEIRVTISMGLVESLHDSGEAALRAADRCLYQAKAAGRDRIICEQPA